jgi:hypothetical protein
MLTVREPFDFIAQDMGHDATAQDLLVAVVCLQILRDEYAACRWTCILQS